MSSHQGLLREWLRRVFQERGIRRVVVSTMAEQAEEKRVRKVDQEPRSTMSLRTAFTLAMIMVMCSPAYAQFEKGTQGLNKVQGWLLSIGVVVFSLAIMFVGVRMAFQAAQWKDVAPVFWGGILFGGGPAFASLFF